MRAADAADHAFIFHSWLRSYAGSAWAKAMAEPLYMAGQHLLIERLLQRAGATVVHPEGDPATVLGWSCREDSTLHYVYVKGDLRRAGIGKLLVPDVAIYTHKTYLGERFLRAWPQAIYNPVRAYAED